MTDVTKEQFEYLCDLKVRHVPTGATFSTYRYDDPKHTSISFKNLGRADERLPNGDDYEASEIERVALALLRERASQRR